MTEFSIKLVLFFLKLATQLAWVVICIFPALLEAIFRLIFPPKPKNVNGQVALITGAAQGLGRAMALELSQRGSTVICVDINSEGNENTAKEIVKLGRKAYAYTCDVTNRESVAELAKKVGPIDILINNAGLIVLDSFLDTPPSLVQKVIDVNVSSQFWMIHAFLSGMLERDKGHIVGIASGAGLYGLPKAVVYTASKFAVVGLMTTLEDELRQESRHNIKITCVCPYFIRTITEIDTRIRALVPPLEAEEAARLTIEGVLREETLITIPSHMQGAIYFRRLLPKRIQNMLTDIFYTNVISRNQNETQTSEILKNKPSRRRRVTEFHDNCTLCTYFGKAKTVAILKTTHFIVNSERHD